MLQVKRQRSCYASQDKDVFVRYPGACGTARKQPGCVLFSAKTSTVTLWTAFKRVRVDSAWRCMRTYVHLLMTPPDTARISRLMQRLGRYYVLYISRQYRRTGTLWEGRHRASLVQADKYLLTCMRYVE